MLFRSVADGLVYCALDRKILTRALDAPAADWVRWCGEPAYGAGERGGTLFVAAGRLYMTASPDVHYSCPLADPAVGWVRTPAPPRVEGFAEVRGTLFGNDGKSLLSRPASDLNAGWTPVGPWPDGCETLLADGDRLLAFGGVGPIYARPKAARPDVPWVIVGRVHDPFKR